MDSLIDDLLNKKAATKNENLSPEELAYFRNYRANHKEMVSESRKNYAKNNKDKVNARHKKYRDNNKEKIENRNALYRLKNHEKVKEIAKLSNAKYRAKEKEYKEIAKKMCPSFMYFLLLRTTHRELFLEIYKKGEVVMHPAYRKCIALQENDFKKCPFYQEIESNKEMKQAYPMPKIFEFQFSYNLIRKFAAELKSK